MKLQKRLAIWSGIISSLAIGSSVVLNLVGCAFASNICVGVFSSGILVCVVAIVTFYAERDRELKRLSEKTFELMMAEVENARREEGTNIYELRRNIEAILRLCTVDIRNCVVALSETRHNSKLYKAVADLWEQTSAIGAAYSKDYYMIVKYIGGMVSEAEFERYEPEAILEKTKGSKERLRESLNRIDTFIRFSVPKAAKETQSADDKNSD